MKNLESLNQMKNKIEEMKIDMKAFSEDTPPRAEKFSYTQPKTDTTSIFVKRLKNANRDNQTKRYAPREPQTSNKKGNFGT